MSLIIGSNAPDVVAEDLKHEHTNTRFDISGGHAYSGGQYVLPVLTTTIIVFATSRSNITVFQYI